MVGVECLVGGWFASPIIKSVLEKAQKYLGANYKWRKGAQKMVEQLTDTLLLFQPTVQEVEKRVIINNQALADWLRMLKENVYEAEDVLDNVEAKSIMDEIQGNNKVIKLASSSLSAVRNMVLSEKNHKSLEKVVDKLKKLSTQIPTILEIVNMNENNKAQTREDTNPRETISEPLEEVGLYGREDELNLILEIILGSPSKSSKKNHGIFVVPIVGMSGVGKTALAQAVYNNSEVQKNFATREWKSVFDLANRSLKSISQDLSWFTKGVKFLIVLDDMFESQWDFIHKILSCGTPGSVVLITTKNQVFANRVVANTVGAIGPIVLSALDSDSFLLLFERFAFGNVVMSEKKRIMLKSIGKEIADKLHGLPLAAKIIGNLLNSDFDENRWRNISKSEWWDIPEGQTKILPSIGLGYEQLNPSLRQCFAYCSLFPRNSLIEKDRLVHMWIAHNFIQSDVNGVRRLEDVGSQWFDELVKKSFFQRAWDNNSYVMHELMHDLAVIVSSGECFYLGEGVAEIPLGVRHLAVGINNLKVIKGIKKHKNLRSFLCFVRCQVTAIQDTLSNLDNIRVLDLSNNYIPPSVIWNKYHLRFLDLSFTGITDLSHSSINLYHLQTLYIRGCNIRDWHNRCFYLLNIPRGINKLVNLRHLCSEEETIAQISGIGQLTNLQELGVFVVREEEGHTIMELENLREIRGTLAIKNFDNIKKKDEAKQAKLADKKHLDSIHIIGNHANRNSNEEEVLQELQPNKDIKGLRIESYAGLEFPNWIIQIGDTFLNLNTLCLVSCFNVKVLPPLGELPSLKHLQIGNFGSVKLIDSHLYGKKQTVFPLLEVLVLDCLFNCEEWTDAGAREFFPRLSKLTIDYNRTLRKAPLNLFSSTLKELKIHLCNSLTSLENCLFSLTCLKLSSSTTSITFDPLNMPFLEDLDLENCPELKIKGCLQSLTHLKRLRLVSSSKLFSTYSTTDQQKWMGLQVHQAAGLQSLTHIEADHSLLNHEYHLILGSLPSLRVLRFSINAELITNDQILWFQELTALEEINFFHFWFDRHLPTGLTLLSSLKKLVLEGCSYLESLSYSLPPNLQELVLSGCSQNLVQRCQSNKGEDWQFISSIPVIRINGTIIHNPQISDETG